MFSIIIPLFNKAAFIEKAIRSVLIQTFKEFELIVLNDGSTDNSLEKLQFAINKFQVENPHQYNRIKIIDQKNQGVSLSRNNGVHVAIHDYIAFLDADDWWEPTYLEEMKNLIEEFPDAGIYGSSYYLIKNEKKRVAPIGIDSTFLKGEINYCRVYAKNLCMPLWTGATIIKKTVFESEKGFDKGLKFGEDFDLWIRIAMKYPVSFLNKPLAYYNQDVELVNRAVGPKLYEPNEHMLFTDYGELNNNIEFRILFEKLSVYSLLPYYLENKNYKEVDLILKGIHWKNHKFKYRLYYLILPKMVVKTWLKILKIGSIVKTKMLS